MRTWFAKNHTTAVELWIRFYRLDSGKPSVTYPQALDEALCVGWIDGIRKRADDESYLQRFTPRKRRSYWSTVNIAKAEALISARRMRPAGLAAFNARDASAAQRYSYENRRRGLPTDAVVALRKDAKAWRFWKEQPAGYRKAVAWWVVSALKDETRGRRIELLVEHSRKAQRVPPLVSPTGKGRKDSR